ncbi:hypothetical protein BDW02DRAFT_342707 [Decorospora gaudefroyi]|uniref:Uncharacterized protein n=1 Tax=Decorospora gaudefroyi TaxID=184978 RepID=A0A6A5KF75_9PLEO|nr:hypothetical protein BDW02DRAFT_342707 [Decorospora gaudefroyi]
MPWGSRGGPVERVEQARIHGRWLRMIRRGTMPQVAGSLAPLWQMRTRRTPSTSRRGRTMRLWGKPWNAAAQCRTRERGLRAGRCRRAGSETNFTIALQLHAARRGWKGTGRAC